MHVPLLLQRNNISAIAEGQLLTSLTYLDLWEDSLTSVPPDVPHLTHLDDLRLSFNRITSLDGVVFPSSLARYLGLGGNLLTSLPDLSYLPNLDHLYLDHNNISNSPTDRFPTSLTMLEFSYNSLTSIPPAVSSITQLATLTVSLNKLTSIDDVTFANTLFSLDASHNSIAAISRVKFNNGSADSRVKYLTLNNNPLTSIAADAFKSMPHIVYLHLENTQLTRLPLTLADVVDLDYLYMEQIPDLVCTCQESALATWYRNSGTSRRTRVQISGSCVGATSIRNFLAYLAPKCPPPSS